MRIKERDDIRVLGQLSRWLRAFTELAYMFSCLNEWSQAKAGDSLYWSLECYSSSSSSEADCAKMSSNSGGHPAEGTSGLR